MVLRYNVSQWDGWRDGQAKNITFLATAITDNEVVKSQSVRSDINKNFESSYETCLLC